MPDENQPAEQDETQALETPEDVERLLREQGFEPARGHNFRAAAEVARETCRNELQAVAAARRDAMARLWRGAEEAIRRQKPKTTPELEEVLRPLFLAYTEHIFAAALKSEPRDAGLIIPALLEDVCGPLYGQIPVTTLFVAESLGNGFFAPADEMDSTRRLLWRSMAEEAWGGPVARNLKTYLSLHLDALALSFEAGTEADPRMRRKPGRPVEMQPIDSEELKKRIGKTPLKTFARLCGIGVDALRIAVKTGFATERTRGGIGKYLKKQDRKIDLKTILKKPPEKQE